MQGFGRTSRHVLGSIALIVLLAVGAALGLRAWLQSDAFRQRLQRDLSQTFGQPVKLAHTATVAAGLPPSLTLHGLHIDSPDWAADTAFLRLRTLTVAPVMSSLLHLRLGLRLVRADHGQVNLKTGPQGQTNWPQPSGNGRGTIRLHSLAGTAIRDITIHFPGSQADTLSVTSLKANAAGAGRLRLTLDGTLRGQSLRGKLGVPDVNRFRNSSEPLSLKLESLHWGPSQANGEVTLTRGKANRSLRGSLQGQDWGVPSTGTTQAAGHKPLPEFPIPVFWRGLPDTDIKLQVASLSAGGLKLKDLTTHLRISGNVLHLDPIKAKLGGASLQTRLVLDAGQQPPRLEYAGRIDHLNLRRSISALVGTKGARGHINTRFDLHGRGKNSQDVFAHLNGDLRLVMAEGKVSTALLNRIALNLGHLLNQQSKTDSGTPVRCLAVQAKADDGIVTLQQSILDTDRLLLVGKGTINLRDGMVNVSLDPSSAGIDPTQVGLPIDIVGPLSHPHGELDVSAALTKVGGAPVSALFGASGIMSDLIGLTEPGNSGCRATLRDYAPNQ